MKKTILLSVICVLALMAACGQPAAKEDQSAQNGQMTISFDYAAQEGYASNQFAVWVENTDGAVVKTLYATRFAAKGGYEKRPDAIPVWVERSGVAQMDNVDAITSATPKSGALQYSWDLTNDAGERVPNGTYRYFVEGTLRWKNHVLYTGEITLGGEATSSQASAEYAYVASDDSPALTDDSPEHSMITNVTAVFTPPTELPQ